MARIDGVGVVGMGTRLADRELTNEHFASYLDTSDAWIRERTGIVSRRVGGTTVGLAVDAASSALADAGLEPRDVGCLILATTTPDQQIPASSAAVHHALGLRCGAFDLNAGCSGFVVAATVGASLTSSFGPVLVVGSEVLTRVTDPSDRQTAILMADGAGAVVLDGSDRGRMWTDLGVDGSLTGILYADHGGTMHMQGREVFRNAVRACAASCERVVGEAGYRFEDVDLFVPHQANRRIIDAVAERLGIEESRCAITVDTTGNTSAASIPIALAAASAAGRVSDGDLVLLSGFGAGMTWASALLRW